MENGTKYVYTSGLSANNEKIFTIDSSLSNLGKSSPRHYYGADIQLKLHHGWGETEWRAEYWFGTQPGTSTTEQQIRVLYQMQMVFLYLLMSGILTALFLFSPEYYQYRQPDNRQI